MSANKFAYYENSVPRLEVVPEETRSVQLSRTGSSLKTEKLYRGGLCPTRRSSLPILGIENNPVVYVDPNGEFNIAMLLVRASVLSPMALTIPSTARRIFDG